MSKKEDKAKEYRLKTVLNTERYLEGGSNIEKAYIAGWDAAIDKACEWLEENVGYYVEHWDGDTLVNSKLYDDFKKAMED